MNRVVIDVDVDGTLRDNTVQDHLVANERIRTLVVALASMKNPMLVLWSGAEDDQAWSEVRPFLLPGAAPVLPG